MSLCMTGYAFADVCVYKPPKVHHVRGVVTDHAGQTMSGVEVNILQDGTLISEKKSGPDGHFSFPSLNAGTYELRVHAVGSHEDSYIVYLQRLGGSTRDLHVTMEVGYTCGGTIDLLKKSH